MKQRLIRYICLLVLLLMVACQQTPSSTLVVDKADGAMEAAIQAKPTEDRPEQSPARERWEETIALNEKLKVTIDCAVEAEDGAAHPVYDVSGVRVTSDWMVQVLQGLYPDVNSIRDQEESREELIKELQTLERGSFAGLDEKGEPIWEPFEGQQAQIAAVQEKLLTIPGESTYQELTAGNLGLFDAYKSFVTYGQETGTLFVHAYDQGDMTLLMVNHTKGGILQPEKLVMEGDAIPGESPSALNNVRIAEQDALSLAEKALERAGITGYAISNTEKARYLDGWDIISEGWQFTFALHLQGTEPVAIDLFQEHTLFHADEQYGKATKTGYISIYVTDQGIERFYWESPAIIGACENEDVSLLPFDDVETAIRQYFKYGLSWVENPQSYGLGSTIQVSRMVLTSAAVKKLNDTEQEYLIPCWAVFYCGEEEKESGMEESLLLVNAIDGGAVH